MSDLSGRSTIVVGASRGLGHGIAEAFARAGAPVVAVSRAAATFAEPAVELEVADAGDAEVGGKLIEKYRPETGVGTSAVQAYAALAGKSVDEFLEPMGRLVTPEIAGTALLELVQADVATLEPAYLLTGTGLQPLP